MHHTRDPNRHNSMADELIDKMSKQLHLMEDEAEGVQAPIEAWTTTNENYSLALVGRTLSKHAIHLDSFQQLMKTSWGLMYGLEIKKINEERLLFKFTHNLDKKRVMDQSPWSLKKISSCLLQSKMEKTLLLCL